MVTKCSGALTDGAKTLYPPLYLREPGSDITVIYDVYVTVINEKRSEKPREGFFTLSVYQSTNSGKITPVGLFALFFVFFSVKSQFIRQHHLVAEHRTAAPPLQVTGTPFILLQSIASQLTA